MSTIKKAGYLYGGSYKEFNQIKSEVEKKIRDFIFALDDSKFETREKVIDFLMDPFYREELLRFINLKVRVKDSERCFIKRKKNIFDVKPNDKLL